jgi:hypothetical protein
VAAVSATQGGQEDIEVASAEQEPASEVYRYRKLARKNDVPFGRQSN